MADETVQIIISVTSEQAQQALKAVQGAIKGVGAEAATSLPTMTGHVERAAASFGNFAIKVAGVLAGYTAFSQSARMVADILKGTVEHVDALARSSTNLAMILTSLQKPGGNTFAQNLAYADQVMDSLRRKAAELGVQFRYIDMTVRDFADIGVFARSEKDLDAMAQISRYAQAIAVTRREGIGAEMQIKQLLEGQISAGNQVAGILMANLGVDKEQLITLMRQAQARGDLIQFVQRGLNINQDALKAANNLISVQTGLLKDNVATIEIMAGRGMWAGIVSGLQEINKWLRENAAEIASRLRPELNKIGAAFKEFADYLVTHKDQVTEALRSIAFVAERIAAALEWATKAAIAFAAGFRVQGGYGTADDRRREADRRDAQIAEDESERRRIGASRTPTFLQPSGTRLGQIGSSTGGGKSAFEIARDAIAETAAHQRALANTIDDTAERETRLAAILRQEATAYQELAKHAATKLEAAQLTLKIQELLAQAAQTERNAARASVDAHVQASREFIADLRGRNQMSTQDEIAANQRVLDWLKSQKGPEAAKLAREEELVIIALRKREVDEGKKAQTERVRQYEDEIALRRDLGQEDTARFISDKQAELDLVKGNAAEERRIHNEIAIVRHQQHVQVMDDALQEFGQRVQIAQQTSAGAIAALGGRAPISDRAAVLRDELVAIQAIRAEMIRAAAATAQNEAEARKWRLAIEQVDRQIASVNDQLIKVTVETLSKATEAIVSSTESAFSTLFQDLLTGAKSFGSAFIGLFQTIGKTILKEITDAVAQSVVQMLGIRQSVQSVMGSIFSYLGVGASGGSSTAAVVGNLIMRGQGGLFPGSFTPIAAFAGGGVAYGPTLGLIGEAGPEAAVPLRNGRIPVDLHGGGHTFQFFINAVDGPSVQQLFYDHRDFLYDLMGEGRRMNDGALR